MENIEVRILEEFKQGRLELLYQRLYPALLLYAIRQAGSRYDFLAEDWVQDAIFNAWQRKEHFDSIYALKSFLYISIKNKIISTNRKRKAKERYTSELEDSIFFANSVIDQEIQLLLHHAIHALPEKERKVFELCVIEGLKNAEAAERLGVSVSTVKKAKAKALDILKGKLVRVLLLFFFLNFVRKNRKIFILF